MVADHHVRERVRAIIDAVREGKRKVLTIAESSELLSSYGIPIARYGIARTLESAIKIAEEIGYPVALKVLSPTVVHKTDIGGVKLNLSSADEVRVAYQQIIEQIKSYGISDVMGILVQEMIRNGIELIIGMKRDATFGPTVLFGLGGIFVEVLKDVAIRVVPVTERDVYEMIEEIRGYPLLLGYRGQPKRDIKAIVDIILKVAKIAEDIEEISEMDLNPVIVREEGRGAVVVDSRVIIS